MSVVEGCYIKQDFSEVIVALVSRNDEVSFVKFSGDCVSIPKDDRLTLADKDIRSVLVKDDDYVMSVVLLHSDKLSSPEDFDEDDLSVLITFDIGYLDGSSRSVSKQVQVKDYI
jgi:hypothetical protein